MKTFDVYRHPTLGYEAVKQGFGWPAFFCTWIWAFVKKMWGWGCIILGAFSLLLLVESAFEQEGSAGGYMMMNLGQLALSIFIGFKGNEWRRGNLEKRRFKKLSTVQAETPDAAIGEVAEQGS